MKNSASSLLYVLLNSILATLCVTKQRDSYMESRCDQSLYSSIACEFALRAAREKDANASVISVTLYLTAGSKMVVGIERNGLILSFV